MRDLSKPDAKVRVVVMSGPPIGDNADKTAMATLVSNINPDYICAIPIDELNVSTSYTNTVNTLYSRWKDAQAFFPICTNPNSATTFKNYFTYLPSNAYDNSLNQLDWFKELGPLAVAGVHTYVTDPQAAWLYTNIRDTACPWKIVLNNWPPCGSLGTALYGQEWGGPVHGGYENSTMIISGGYRLYERLSLNGLTYINNGIGRRSVGDSFSNPVSGSVVRLNQPVDSHSNGGRDSNGQFGGVMLLEATWGSLTMSLIDLHGKVLDKVEWKNPSQSSTNSLISLNESVLEITNAMCSSYDNNTAYGITAIDVTGKSALVLKPATGFTYDPVPYGTSFKIHSFSGHVDGQLLFVINDIPTSIIPSLNVAKESPAATAENRLFNFFGSQGFCQLTYGASSMFYYSASLARWVLLTHPNI